MKILVTGAGGLLGQDVWKVFSPIHEMTAVGRRQPAHVPTAKWRACDLTDAATLYRIVTRENPDAIIHCGAYNNVDAAEIQQKDALLGNAMATRNLALACQRFDTVLVSVSTDHVFDGASPPEEGYREFDATNPVNYYGLSKLWAEKFVQQLLNKFMIVRTSWLFGPGRPTWVDHVASCPENNEPIIAIEDLVSSPTYTPDLTQALLQLTESHRFGIYHITNSGYCSRVELAREVLRLKGKANYAKLRILQQSEFKLPAPRPPFSALQNLAWSLDGFPKLRTWQEALKEHFAGKKVVA